MGVVPYTVLVGSCAVIHILGTLVRAWVREGWKVNRGWQKLSESPPPLLLQA